MALTLLGQHHSLASPTEQLKMLGEDNELPPSRRNLITSACSRFAPPESPSFRLMSASSAISYADIVMSMRDLDRTERMSRETAEQCIRALAQTDIPTVDITGWSTGAQPQLSMAG